MAAFAVIFKRIHKAHYGKTSRFFCFIEATNETIAGLRERLRRMERNLNDPNLAEDRKRELSLELKEIAKLLETNEQLLHKMHKENSKSFAVAACLFFICFLVYGLYVLVNGA
uniref:Coiled-coil domain-containing protein 167 n=1 Tax=Anopheles albimanus TaxID=7167 RepID=A0A182FCH4_ANOAL